MLATYVPFRIYSQQHLQAMHVLPLVSLSAVTSAREADTVLN